MQKSFFNYRRKIFSVIILFCFINTVFANSPRIALVLSGGGARGLAQIGVLKALDEAGIKPDIIIATSMGAIIGTMYSMGLSPSRIESIIKTVDWDDIFANSAHRRNLFVSQKNEPINYLFELRFNKDLTPIIPNSISHGQTIYELLSGVTSAPLYHAKLNFDSLAVPIRIVTTDIVTGRSIVFSHGDLLQAVRASCGVPLAFSPVTIDSMLLLDGGLTANIPVEAAKLEDPDFIIAVDVTSPMWKMEHLDNPIRLVEQVIAIGITNKKKKERKLADIIIKPKLEGFLNTDFTSIDIVIERGYYATKEKIPLITQKIKELETQEPSLQKSETKNLPLPVVFQLQRDFKNNDLDSIISILNKTHNSVQSEDSLRKYISGIFNEMNYPFANAEITRIGDSGTHVVINPGIINEVAIEGNYLTSPRLIKTTSGLKENTILTNNSIKKAVSDLYASNLFYNVNILVDSLLTVNIKLKEKEYWRSRFGLRFDEYYLLEGYIQPAYENLFGTAFCASLHLQYGTMREKYAFDLHTNRPWSHYWANNFTIQSYISRETIVDKDSTYVDTTDTTGSTYIIEYEERTLRKAGILAGIGTQIGRTALLEGSIRLEKFKVTKSGKSAIVDPLGPTFKHGIRYLMLRLSIDNLDRFPFPQKGQKHYISIGGTSDIIGGTENFVNLHASLNSYFTFGKRHTCSPRAMFAWTDQALPPVEQVYIGGTLPDEKYRDLGVYNYIPFVGLKPRSISGDIMMLLHGLYRFAITKKLYLNALVDWGYAWHEDNNADEPDFEFDIRTVKYFIKHAPVGFGLGLAYQTLVGPIRLSWGRVVFGSLKEDFDIEGKNVIYFSAGHDF